MRINIRSIYFITAIFAGVMLVSACKEDTSEQDNQAQEQRFFDLYVGKNYPNVQPESNGLYYFEHKAGTGSFPDSDDWILVNHVSYKIPTNVIYESYIESVARDNQFYNPVAMYGPYKMQNGTDTPGLQQGLVKMREGALATIFFTSELGYGSEGNGKINPYQSLKYEIELLEVIKDIDSYELDRINAYLDTIPQFDTIKDPASDAIMYYIVDKATEGTPVVNDSIIEIAYKGYLMDGRVFDEKDADDPLDVKLGTVQLIHGWDLGLLKLKEGEKARFIIPYQLAYGEAGSKDNSSGLRVVPPYETLLFDIEIISVE